MEENLSEDEHRAIAAEMYTRWEDGESKINVEAPFDLADEAGPIHCIALIESFGSSAGTVVLNLDSADAGCLKAVATKRGYYHSLLAEAYNRFDRDLFVATLNDCGWKGGADARPDWCTDEPWTN
jgi:hypothetical protein